MYTYNAGNPIPATLVSSDEPEKRLLERVTETEYIDGQISKETVTEKYFVPQFDIKK